MPEQSIEAVSNHDVEPYLKTFKETFSSWLKIIISRFVFNLSNLVPYMFLSSVDAAFLQAGAVFSATERLPRNGIMGVLFNISREMSKAIGQGNYKEAGKLFRQALLLIVVLSALFMPLMIWAKPLFKSLGQTTEVAESTQSFFRAYAPGLPFFLFGIIAQQIAVPAKKENAFLATAVLQSTLLVLLSYIMILGKWGCDKLGAAGLGLAYTFSSIISFFTLMLYYQFTGITKKYHLLHFKEQGFIELCRASGKSAIKSLAVALLMLEGYFGILLLTLIIGAFNSGKALAATQVALQILTLIKAPFDNGAQTVSQWVGKQLGEGKPALARRYGNVGLVYGSLGAIVSLAIVIPAASLLAKLFTSAEDIINLASYFLQLMVIGQFFDVERIYCVGALRGYSDTFFSMVIGFLFNVFCSAGFGCLLNVVAGLGAEGMLEARAASVFLGSIFMFYRWFTYNEQETSKRSCENWKLCRCYFWSGSKTTAETEPEPEIELEEMPQQPLLNLQ